MKYQLYEFRELEGLFWVQVRLFFWVCWGWNSLFVLQVVIVWFLFDDVVKSRFYEFLEVFFRLFFCYVFRWLDGSFIVSFVYGRFCRVGLVFVGGSVGFFVQLYFVFIKQFIFLNFFFGMKFCVLLIRSRFLRR